MPKPGNKRFVVIIPVAEKAAVEAKGFVKAIFGPVDTHPHDDVRGEYFRSELVPFPGPIDAPVSHYWACAETTNAIYNSLKSLELTNGATVEEYDEVADHTFPLTFLPTVGLQKRKVSVETI